MFLMTWRGMVNDRSALREGLLEWMSLFAETAAREGWIGSSGGITKAGEFIALGLMDSAEAARRTGDRTGQAEWWTRQEPHYGGPVVFRNCSGVEVSGDVDHLDQLQARSLEVIEGRSLDIARMRALAPRTVQASSRTHPDVVALLLGFHDEDPGRFTQAIYRTHSADVVGGGSDRAQETIETDDVLLQLAALARDTTSNLIENPWVDWSR